jgi:hypothetical protein
MTTIILVPRGLGLGFFGQESKLAKRKNPRTVVLRLLKVSEDDQSAQNAEGGAVLKLLNHQNFELFENISS